MIPETNTAPTTPALTPERVETRMKVIKRMLMVAGLFAAVGYLLVGGALYLEFFQFHPAIEQFFATQTAHSLAGCGPDGAGDAVLNGQLATIHKFPSLLLWMKLGGIAHILVGIFVALGAIVRALAMMPERLGTVVTTAARSTAADATPADD
jgi:small-conductance mechanosensitive channel